MIHPNAFPATVPTPKSSRDLPTAMGKARKPPLVVVMANAPATKATRVAPKDKPTVSMMVNFMTQNMRMYANQIKKVWKIKGHFRFILNMLSTP